MANKNAWSSPLYKPKYPRLDIASYSRENDITLSLGRQTDYEEVLGLLWKAGCIDPSTLLDSVSQMRITKNVDNGQIFVTCANDNVADIWVDKLNGLTGTDIKKCHSYTDKEIPVKFSFIHASIDVQKDIVDGFLSKYGRIKEWFPLKDKKFGIPNGSYIFVMYEEDLEKKPLPECVFLNHIQVYISYRTQVIRCHNCNEAGHFSRECPKDLSPSFPRLHSGSATVGSPFLSGKVPNANDNRKKIDNLVSSISNSAPVIDSTKVSSDNNANNAKDVGVISSSSVSAQSSSTGNSTGKFDDGKKASQSSQLKSSEIKKRPSSEVFDNGDGSQPKILAVEKVIEVGGNAPEIGCQVEVGNQGMVDDEVRS